MMSCFEGLLEYYRETGIEKYKQAIVNFADMVLESDFTIIGSCGCTHELFDHSTVRQANTTNGSIMQETCVTVTLMKFLYQLTQLTGNSKYVDAFEISMYNAYMGSINTEKVVEPSLMREHSDWCIEPLPFDSYSPLTAGTRGNGIGGLKLMSDNHYYGCCACIGAAGLGLIPKMACLQVPEGVVLNLFLQGKIETVTPGGQNLTISMETGYPVTGKVRIILNLKNPESFDLMLRIPQWSKKAKLVIDGVETRVDSGYAKLTRKWSDKDCVELELDMTTKAVRPVSYGHQVLMNKVVWGANYIIPTYDEEDPLAKHHLALQRGPVVLAQENRLGYSVDKPVSISVNADNTVDAEFPEQEIAPYRHLLELEILLANGEKMHVTDYASAGKLWTEESKMAAWILVE